MVFAMLSLLLYLLVTEERFREAKWKHEYSEAYFISSFKDGLF